jgi:hypothetical protein
VGGYKCDCAEKLIGRNCEVLVKDACPYSDCAKKFDGGKCIVSNFKTIEVIFFFMTKSLHCPAVALSSWF